MTHKQYEKAFLGPFKYEKAPSGPNQCEKAPSGPNQCEKAPSGHSVQPQKILPRSAGKKFHMLCFTNARFQGPFKRRAGRIAQQYNASSVHKPHTPTSAQKNVSKHHFNKKLFTRRGKCNKNSAQVNKLKRTHGRRMWRKVKQADAMQVRSLAARVLPMQIAHEATTATVKQKPNVKLYSDAKRLLKEMTKKYHIS